MTQVAAGCTLVGLGDAASQHLVEKRRSHSWGRTGNMVLLRGMFHSTLIIYWYRLLQRALPMTHASLNQRVAT